MNCFKLAGLSSALLVSLAAAAPQAIAQQHGMADHAASHAATGGLVGSGQMTEGELRKVDRAAKRVTIHHGEIKNLGMPAMTMVFQVRDEALLAKVKQGDKVRFRAENNGGAMVLTALEVVK